MQRNSARGDHCCLSHERAAKNLGVDHETLPLEHGGGEKWRAHGRDDWSANRPGLLGRLVRRAHGSDDWSDVEVAALNHYSRDGWRGYPGEGGLMLNLIKAAAFPDLPERLRATYTEALFSGNMTPRDQRPLDELLARILAADSAQVTRVFRLMAAPRPQIGLENSMLDFFPHLREWHFTELFENLGRARLHDIACAFGADSYEYRKGWPDLTLWRDGEVIFKEVKAPGDRLHASQRKTIRDILLPLGYRVAIVDVVPA